MSAPAYRFVRASRLAPSEKALWSGLLRDRDFGEIAIDWCDSLLEARPENFELHYYQVFAGERRRALVILHVLRQVDLSRYMGRAIRRLFAGLSALGWHPLRLDLAFIEIPLGNLSGILLAPGAEPESLEIARQARAVIQADFDYDLLCLKASPGAPGEADWSGLGMLSTDFLANMSLPLNGMRTFEEYLGSLRPRRRSEARAYQRTFAAAGGTIEVCAAPGDAELDAMARLYQRTCDHHASLGEIEVPIRHGKEFFKALSELPGHRTRVFLTRLKGEVVGFGLTVESGRALYFTHCGLEYERTLPTRAYFSLYYALIDFAIRQGYDALELGAQAYEVKRRLGGAASPTRYHFEVARPVLGAVARLVARNLSSQKGSEISAG